MNVLVRTRFRDELRAARARTHRNAEGFAEIVRVVGRIARYNGARGSGMGAFAEVMTALARESPLAEDVPAAHPRYLDRFGTLYESTRIGRNLSIHEGAYARNVARHAARDHRWQLIRDRDLRCTSDRLPGRSG